MQKKILYLIALAYILSNAHTFCMNNKKKDQKKTNELPSYPPNLWVSSSSSQEESPHAQDNTAHLTVQLEILKTLKAIQKTQNTILKKQKEQEEEIQTLKTYCEALAEGIVGNSKHRWMSYFPCERRGKYRKYDQALSTGIPNTNEFRSMIRELNKKRERTRSMRKK